MSNQIKILLTGAEGYVGGLVYEQLEILRRYSFMNPDLAPNIYVKPLFFLDQQSIKHLTNEKFDFIFHCAVVGGRNFDEDDPSVFEKNIELFNLLKQLSYKKIIHFTSAADLGRQIDIVNELPESVLNSTPLDYFGKSKKNICNEIIKNKLGLNLRIFNIYGRNETKSQNFIDTAVEKLLLNEEININSDRLFDIFYIDNLRPILFKIINNEMDFDYNLVYEKKYKISDFILFIAKTLKSKSKINIINNGKMYTGKNIFRISKLDSIDPFDDLRIFLKSQKLYVE